MTRTSKILRPQHVSPACALRLQAAVATATLIALVAGGVNYLRPSGNGADAAPIIVASNAPVKIHANADYVEDDDVGSALADASGEVKAAADVNAKLSTKLVKAISVKADGSPLGVAAASTLDVRATELRFALGQSRTPGSELSRAPNTPSTNAPRPPQPELATPAIGDRSISVAPQEPTVISGSIVIAESTVSAESTLIAKSAVIAKSATPANIAASQAPVRGGYSIQLASSTSEEAARKLAQKLQSKLASDLGRRDLSILSANVRINRSFAFAWRIFHATRPARSA